MLNVVSSTRARFVAIAIILIAPTLIPLPSLSQTLWLKPQKRFVVTSREIRPQPVQGVISLDTTLDVQADVGDLPSRRHHITLDTVAAADTVQEVLADESLFSDQSGSVADALLHELGTEIPLSGTSNLKVQAVEYDWFLGDDFFLPLFLNTSIPFKNVGTDNDISSLLLDETGGLANIAFKLQPKIHMPSFLHFLEFSDPNKGLFAEASGAGRLFLAFRGPKSGSAFIDEQAAAGLTWRTSIIRKEITREDPAGAVQLRLSGVGNYCADENFNSMFTTMPRAYRAHLNFDAAVNIAGVLDASFGTTFWSSEPLLAKRSYATLSFRKN